jgi:phosphatidylglycerol lysyltransferase
MRPNFRKYAGPICSLILFTGALWILGHEAQEVRLQHILSEIKAIPGERFWPAVVLTALSYTLMTGYDFLAIRFIQRTLSTGQIALASFLGYAFSNNIGLSMLAGASVRYRLYSGWGLSALEITKVVSFCTVSLWLGFFGLGGAVFVWEPLAIPPGWHVPFTTVQPLGVMLLSFLTAYLALAASRKQPLRIRGWEVVLPSSGILLAQILLACLDWLLAATVLYALLPPALPLPFAKFLGIYLLAQLAGLASQIPGGLGVFETAMLVMLPGNSAQSQVLGALVAYRGIYYLAPLAVATVVLSALELLRMESKLIRYLASLKHWASAVLPNFLGCNAFIAGAVLLLSGATPALETRLDWLSRLLPLPLLELSHFMGSIAGVALLVLARGLQRRFDSAYYLTLALLGIGALASLLKGLDYEEAFLLGLVFAIMLPCRRQFYRRGSLFSQYFSPSWIAAILIVVIGSIGLGLFAFKHLEFSNELWWQFTFEGDGPRFMRASVGISAVMVFLALNRLLRGGAPRGKPGSAFDPVTVRSIIAASPDTGANLALTGDKSFLFNEAHTAFIMYAVSGRSWVSMGNPVGPQTEWHHLIWRFRELSDRYDAWSVFYQVDAGSLHVYLDLGLSFLKLGEEARVLLPDFSLEGGVHRNLRQSWKKAAREGNLLEIIEPGAVHAGLLDEMRLVSDAWLAEKGAREKGFSIGSFRVGYLRQFPMAVVRQEGKMLAFANLWLGNGRMEISIDLMRFMPGASYGLMDFLLTELILWGQKQSFQWFNLGMAPLTGIENRELASSWNRLTAFIARHGEHFYNFQGLRQYKQKFNPVWTPKYLATPGGLALPRVIANVTALISGGIRGAVSK